MKKAIFLTLCLLIGMSILAVNTIRPANARHTMQVQVFPQYYNGGGETKTFMIKNNMSSEDSITKVVIVFPKIKEGDTDYLPVKYEVVVEGNPTAQWSATYEANLRQVTFETLGLEEAYGIPPGKYANFTIVFADGPKIEGNYTWIVSTTDVKREGYTAYPWQIIDATKPFVRIDIPKDKSIVNATMVSTGSHYMWIYVTAYDHPLFNAPNGSDISKVEIQIDSGPWIDITNGKIPGTNQYKYQYWNLATGKHTITAKAWDGAGNWNSTTHTFTYQIVIPRVTVGPTTTYNETTGLVTGSIYKTLGTNYTIEWSSGLTPNADVFIEIYLPTYDWYASQPGKSHWVLVAKTKSDSKGGGKASFIFPTTPQGIYTIRARTGNLNYTQIVEVIPGMVLEPGTITGPALINVTATGLTANAFSYGSSVAIKLICNDTDALLGINLHTIVMWYTNGNGTLSTMASTSDHFTNTGFFMPTFEPGTYEITIGVSNGYRWNGTNFVQIYTEISGKVIVKDALAEIKSNAADAANKAADAAKYAENATKNAADAANKAADAAKYAENATKNAADAANKAKDAGDAAKNAADAAKNAESAAKNAADATNEAKGVAQGLTMPVYLAVIFSLIAAIIAAISTALVYRKIA